LKCSTSISEFIGGPIGSALALLAVGTAKTRDEPIGPGFGDNVGVYAGFAAALAKIDSKGGIEV
jgi:hypothetical protein